MFNLSKVLMLSLAVAGLTAPIAAEASRAENVSCSVSVTYLLNGVVRENYQQSFVAEPTAPFSDDFSTFTRQKFFDASTYLDGRASVVQLSYFSDVGAFDYVDFLTTLTLRDDRDAETVSGSHTYYSSVGVAGTHTTNYSFTCQRVR